MADPVPNLHTDFAAGASGSLIDGDLASRIMAESQSFGSVDLGAVNAALSSLGGHDSALAGSVLSDVSARLTPVEQGQLAAEADIVVTAERRPVSDAEIAAYDRANEERRTEAVSFADTRQLDVAEGYFHAQQTLTGPKANDAEIQSRFDAYRADVEGRERVANAVADRGVTDVVKAVIPPLDTAAALYRVGVNGEYTLENGLTIGGAALGGVAGVVGKRGVAAVEKGGISLPVVLDGEFATKQLLGTTTTPSGRQVMFHAAFRMVNPPSGRVSMSLSEVDAVLDGATSVVKRSYHPEGGTLTIENAKMPGRPRVIVDEATGQRVITVINPKKK
ncbi:hypothetical protein COC42_11175 [Sphingomonas spermidinifaciens]|uniref:Uncharacterized protein n=1 Tax=Sphingomonas spermidinifaciens TaxID=1141889 RepID=A0A2A4B1U2_9SPHN|nr:hypothetical protein [Sphingomonas spermidinifaciens]PCD02040.1 hypothetical protein COC42_11175 [Sphingomonas spermidinifaciens]